MKRNMVLTAAHKAEATGFYRPAVEFLVSDTGKSFTHATVAIEQAIKDGQLDGTAHKKVTLTDKGRAAFS